jgi:hypothetical protein
MMLEPQKRLSIYDILRPPVGFSIDILLACTYSVSLDTVLSLPAAMLADLPGMRNRNSAFTAVELAALKRVCDRTLIFCQGGQIHPAKYLPPAIIEAERMVHEVRVPKPMGGAFHPKLWVIRFVASASGQALIRIAILSRNLTADRSWDLGIVVDSRGISAPRVANDLSALLRALPSMCLRPLEQARCELIEELARDVEAARWRPPDGIGSITFHALGLTAGRRWVQPRSDRLAVISPFLTTSALVKLAASSTERIVLVSRADALGQCWAAARDGFARQAVLAAPNDPALPEATAELHGKALVWQNGKRVRMAVGSMNATSAAMDGRNVEFMVSFDCTKALSNVGIEALLDRRSFGAVIEDFEPPDPVDEKLPVFDDRPARAALLDAKLRISCVSTDEGWRIALLADGTVGPALPALLPELRFRPATLSANRSAKCGLSLVTGEPATFPGILELSEITGFTVFEADGPSGLISFTLNLEVCGPNDEERRQAALRALLPDQLRFAEFLRVLLGDFAALEALIGTNGADGTPTIWRAAQPGLLELLIRCATDDPERLKSIRQILDSLGRDEVETVAPEGFSALWTSVMRAAELSQ